MVIVMGPNMYDMLSVDLFTLMELKLSVEKKSHVAAFVFHNHLAF